MVCILLVIVLSAASTFFSNEKEILLVNEETSIVKLNDWTVESEVLNAQVEMTDFGPHDIEFKPYRLIREITTTEYKKPVIMFESMHQSFTVSVNSELIYEFGEDNGSFFTTPHGGIWHIIELPEDQIDNIIEINIIPSTDETSVGISEIRLAERSEAVSFLVINNAAKLLISCIILIIGITLLVAQAFISRGMKDNNIMLYLAFLSIIMGAWLLSESNLVQLLIGNTFFVGNLPYWAIQLLLIPFIFYVDSMYTSSHKSIGKYFTIAFILNFIISTLLHMTGIVYYYSSLWVVHVIIVATLVYFIGSLLYEAFGRRNKDAGILLLQISFLILAAIGELSIFYLGSNMNSVGVILQIGMLLYLLTCVISTSLKLRSIWVESMHTEYLSKIAYTDTLTTLYNRHAFERDLEVFKESSDDSKIIITFDLNHLKYYNDTIGHQTGDNYLKFFAELAREYLGEYGNCYRVGGDEFSAILYDIPFTMLENQLLLIQNKFKSFDDSNMPGVAIGYAHYDKDEYPNILDYLNHIDACMFKNKTETKQETK